MILNIGVDNGDNLLTALLDLGLQQYLMERIDGVSTEPKICQVVAQAYQTENQGETDPKC